MNVVGELNTLYLAALREIRAITGEARTSMPDRITRIRAVLDKLADDTWKSALTVQRRMTTAQELIKDAEELIKGVREQMEQLETDLDQQEEQPPEADDEGKEATG